MSNNKENKSYNGRLSVVETAIKFIEKEIEEIKDYMTNHLPTELKEINIKLNKRPSWSISLIITFLTGIVMFLLGILAKQIF